jgi:hypothetical protein
MLAAVLAVAAAAATVTIDGKAYPICENVSAAGPVDAYGRRWGWENSASCVVLVDQSSPSPSSSPSPLPTGCNSVSSPSSTLSP